MYIEADFGEVVVKRYTLQRIGLIKDSERRDDNDRCRPK